MVTLYLNRANDLCLFILVVGQLSVHFGTCIIECVTLQLLLVGLSIETISITIIPYSSDYVLQDIKYSYGLQYICLYRVYFEISVSYYLWYHGSDSLIFISICLKLFIFLKYFMNIFILVYFIVELHRNEYQACLRVLCW